MKYHVLEGGKPAVILSEKRNDWNNNVFNTLEEAESYLLHWLVHYAPEVGVVKLNEKYVFEQEHKQYVEIIGIEEQGPKIYKHVLTVTFYSQEPLKAAGPTLSEIGYQMDQGDYVGNTEWDQTDVEIVGKENIVSELEEIGNDGTFFDFEEEEEEN